MEKNKMEKTLKDKIEILAADVGDWVVGAGVIGMAIGAFGGFFVAKNLDNDTVAEQRIPEPKYNQRLIVEQDDSERLRYVLLENGNNDAYWDYAKIVDEERPNAQSMYRGNWSVERFVDTTQVKGPIPEGVNLVGPEFFDKYYPGKK